MRYEMHFTPIEEEVIKAQVKVFDNNEVLIVAGDTQICTADEAVARDYIENIYLSDLRINNKKLSGLILPYDVPAEG